MSAPLFDLVYLGEPSLDGDKEKVTIILSTVLKIDPLRARALLAQRGMSLREAIPETEAKALQIALATMGVRSNYRPAARTSTDFELVPIDQEAPDEARVVECPECRTTVGVTKRDWESARCPGCGLVFAKHDDAEQNRQRQAHAARTAKLQQEQQQAEARRLRREERLKRFEAIMHNRIALTKRLRVVLGVVVILMIVAAMAVFADAYQIFSETSVTVPGPANTAAVSQD